MLDGNNVENIIKNTTDDARSIVEKIVDKDPRLAVFLIVILLGMALFTTSILAWGYYVHVQTQATQSLLKTVEKDNIEMNRDHDTIIKIGQDTLDAVKKVEKNTEEIAESREK